MLGLTDETSSYDSGSTIVNSEPHESLRPHLGGTHDGCTYHRALLASPTAVPIPWG
jgi:hypothetical protein